MEKKTTAPTGPNGQLSITKVIMIYYLWNSLIPLNSAAAGTNQSPSRGVCVYKVVVSPFQPEPQSGKGPCGVEDLRCGSGS